MKKVLLIGITFLLLGATLTSGPIAAEVSQEEFSGTVVLAEAAWPGIEAKNAVVAYILNNIGYEAERQMLDVPIVFQGLSEGDVTSGLEVGCRVRSQFGMRLESRDENLTCCGRI